MKNLQEPTVSAALVLDLFDGLNEFKLLNEQDLERLGISREEFIDVEKRMPLSLVQELWQCAYAKNPPNNLGLCIGQNLNPMARGIMTLLASHSKNLGEALQLFHNKSGLMSEGERVKFSIKDNTIKIRYQYLNPEHAHKFAIERSFATALAWCRHLTGHSIPPLEVGFRHDPVDYMAQCHDVFGPNILFNQSQDYMLFDVALMTLPLLNPDPYIQEILLKRAEKIEQKMAGDKTLTNQVSKTIEAQLGKGEVNVQFVASKLNMSRQTLHRKLQKEDTHFSNILTHVRKQLAQEYLKQADPQIERLSEKLGFEEPSAFFKAFKSWFKTTPKNYQKYLIEQAS